MTTSSEPALDLLAVGAHPDDAELFCGGALALAVRRGLRVGILDLTRGECGTRGSAEIRDEEKSRATQILGLAERVTLDLGDGRFENSHENRRAVVEQLRTLRPRVVVTHRGFDRHPDHGRAHELVRDACFMANVGGFDAPGARHRIEELVYFIGHEAPRMPDPDWIVDVTETYETKLEAVRAYSTQFHVGESDGGARDDKSRDADSEADCDARGASGTDAGETYISSEAFWKFTEANSRRWGHLIGADHGEAFVFARPAHAAHSFVRLFDAGDKK